jgi:hypothetical protein
VELEAVLGNHVLRAPADVGDLDRLPLRGDDQTFE